MPDGDERYVKIVWNDRGAHTVELHGIRKMSELRKLTVFALRYGLKRMHQGKGLGIQPLANPAGQAEGE